MMKAIMIAALTLLVSSQAMATTININGTSGNDTIVFGVLQTRFSVHSFWTNVGHRKYINGTVSTTGAASGDRLFVKGLAGDDTIKVINKGTGNFTIDSLTQIVPWTDSTVLFTLAGGADDDEIDGGNFDDIIYGEGGSDIIRGHNGDDFIIGFDALAALCVLNGDPDSDDYCSGGGGDDVIHCQTGVDGGTGDDDFCTDGTTTLPYRCERLACEQ